MTFQENPTPSTVLTTKLYIPPARPHHIPRPHLIDRLDTGLTHKLILVSAPAGFGKTTLLSEWINGRNIPAAWVSLDERDNDPVGFLRYLIASLQQIEPAVGRGLGGLLQSPQPSPYQAVITAMVNDVATLPDDFLLVLDDYHAITMPAIHTLVTYLLDYLPPQMHMVIATRADPPLPLARLRGRGQLTELRAGDLRFTPAEVTAFLTSVEELTLGPDDIAALTAHTEGWIAGLQMAAVSLRGQADIAGFIQAFTASNRYIFDYLMEEVLQRQPPRIVSFLLETAILDRLSAPLCQVVTGQDDSLAILAAVERANLFIVPLDSERRWYRYHHLFGDLLRQRLCQTLPERVAELHTRASLWHEQQSLIVPAIDHAILAGNHEHAARLLSDSAEALWGNGEQVALARWLDALPEALVHSIPRLCSYRAMILCFSGQCGESERLLQLAETSLEQQSSGSPSASYTEQNGIIAAIRAYVSYLQGRAPDIIRHAQQAMVALPERESMWRCATASVLGDAHGLAGDLSAAAQGYAEAIAIGTAAQNTYFVLLASLKLAVNCLHQARMREARTICQQGLAMVEETGFSRTARAGGLFAIWGVILYEQNDPEQALAYIRRGVALCEQEVNIVLLVTSYTCLFRVSLAMGDLETAEQIIGKLETLAQGSVLPFWIDSTLAVSRVRLWIARSNREPNRLADGLRLFAARGITIDSELNYPRETEFLALARLLLACGVRQPDGPYLVDALRLLDRIYDQVHPARHTVRELETLVLRALVLQAQGCDGKALDSLMQALTLAEPEGYTRIFVDEGPAMARLLYRAVERGVMPDYAGRLLGAMPTSPPAPANGRSHEVLVEPLSEREIEVLQHIVSGASNAEIARDLCIAAGTVKNHVKNIYGKLNVHSRTQALVRAHDLDLVG